MDVIGSWSSRDKTGWGDGPWQDEPDKVHWVDEATDMDCLIVRGPAGALCGYVGVTEEHPAYQMKDPVSLDVDVHGSVTYGEMCDESEDPGKGICHVPLPGRPEHVFWVGFDCSHNMDISPARDMRERERGWDPMNYPGSTYKGIGYVRAEVLSLARQLRAMGS